MNHKFHFLKNLILLYAEDELLTQQQYSRFFESFFKSVVTASDGKEALDLYAEIQPDVLILDISMPNINGLEVCREVRKTDQETPIILLTSYTDKQTLLAAVEMKLTSYLEKPVGRKGLKEALLKLENSRARIKNIPLWEVNQQTYYWNTYKKILYLDRDVIYLTRKETELFQLFITYSDKTLSYKEMYQGTEDRRTKQRYNESAIKTLLKELRLKLPSNVIKNVYGQGYYLDKRESEL